MEPPGPPPPAEQPSPDAGAEAALRRHIESVQRGAECPHLLVVLANLDPPAAAELAQFVIERMPREQSSSRSGAPTAPAAALRE
jgi:hypothetical protein